MKPPSKNMAKSLREQTPAREETISVSKQRPESATDRVIPGESGVERPPGKVSPSSAAHYAGATGEHFGGR